MEFATLNGVTLHYRFTAGEGVPIVFTNSLGTDFRIWDRVIDALGVGAPTLCVDKRGHGLSDTGPITMDLLAEDVAALMDYLGLTGALVCGVSVGGMIAQTLTAQRPDLVSGLVLCCTGAKIGDADFWNARIARVEDDGLAAMSDAILERWFSKGFRANEQAKMAGYFNMLSRTSRAGYTGVCAAIRDGDLTNNTAQITKPAHCIAGTEDLSTPPDLVKGLSDLIQGASYQVFAHCGHLPPIERPGDVAVAVRNMHETLR